MRVAIRCDAAPTIGAGHWMRCLALARALVRDGAEVVFLCRDNAGDFKPVMQASGLPIHWLPPAGADGVLPSVAPVDREWVGAHRHDAPDDGPNHGSADGAQVGRPGAARISVDVARDAQACRAILARQAPDWLIVDHYGLGADWQRRLRERAQRLLVIDDWPETSHDCDLLLNPNLPLQPEAYRPLVPAHCRLLLGPEYALLGPDFLCRAPRPRDRSPRRVLISFGGSDPPGAGLLTMAALARLARAGALDALERITLVAGPANPHWHALRAAAGQVPRLRLVRQARAMAAQLQAADLVIGAAGGSLWERAWLGVPALVLALVPHQRPVAEALAARHAIDYLGPIETLEAKQLAARIAAALRAPKRRREIARNARALLGQAAFIRAPRAFLEAAWRVT